LSLALILSAGLGLGSQPLESDYFVYVTAESADQVHVVRFDGKQASVAELISVGYMPTEIEGPHGLTVDPGGEHWYLSMAHGMPYGTLYKYRTADNGLVGQVELGLFPATMQISADTGLLYCVNFDLHGDMSPSSVSVVDPDEMVEVARTTTGSMPHGSRLSFDGKRHYSCAMMSDELIELDARNFQVRRRLHLDDGTGGIARPRTGDHHDAVTKPTWVQPHPDGKRAFVCLNGSAQVVEVDLNDWEVTRRLPTAKAPYNLEITPDGKQLVVTYKGAAAIGVWDLAKYEEVARLPSTRRITHGVVISPDGKYAFVSSEGIGGEPGSLDVVHLTDLKLVASVDLGLQAGGIAFWKMEERTR